jgi:hypothetical protein
MEQSVSLLRRNGPSLDEEYQRGYQRGLQAKEPELSRLRDETVRLRKNLDSAYDEIDTLREPQRLQELRTTRALLAMIGECGQAILPAIDEIIAEEEESHARRTGAHRGAAANGQGSGRRAVVKAV